MNSENLYVLYIAIEKKLSVEKAFELYETGMVAKKKISKNDVEDMHQLKKNGLTYREIGEIYAVNEDTIYRRLRKYKKGE